MEILAKSILLLFTVAILFTAPAQADNGRPPPSAPGRVTGAITDALGRPLANVSIELRSSDGRRTLARTRSGKDGRFSLMKVTPGIYEVVADRSGFKRAAAIIIVDRAKKRVEIHMDALQALTMEVSTRRLDRERNDLSPETGGSVYRFTAETIKGLPEGDNTSLRNVLTQAPGVTQDGFENGGFHVRAVDGQIQYRINGIMLPDLNSAVAPIFNPRFAQSITLLDGTLPGQFGYRTAGVVDIRTKSGCIGGGSDLGMYGGQRATYQPSFELGGCKDDWDYYLTGQYLQNDLGVQPPTKGPQANHDFTQQGQGFAYISRLINPATRLSLMTGFAVATFQIPTTPNLQPQFMLQGVPFYSPSEVDESQLEQTYYAVLALQGSLNTETDYQLAVFSRYFQSNFRPDPTGDLIYEGVASQVLNSSFANGAQGDVTYRLNPAHTLRGGFYFNEEAVESDNTSLVFLVDSNGNQKTPYLPVSIVDNLNRLTFVGGIYAQDEWRISDKLVVNSGLRWDIMDAFVSDNDVQPRVGAVYSLTPDTKIHAGYAHYFTPPPLELISHKSIEEFDGTSNAVPDVGNENVKPEQDDYFDAGIIRQFTPHIKIGIDTYFDLIHQWLDEAQLGNSLVFSPLNYSKGRSWGTELSSSYNGDNLGAWFNFSYAVAQVSDVSSMQFSVDAAELAYIGNHFIPIDQNQIFTIASGASYRWRRWLFSFDSTWNRGLPFGFANLQTLPSYAQVNIGLGRDLYLPHVGTVSCRAAVVNLFDRVYLIRAGNGLDVNAASYGPRRAGYLGITVPLAFGGRS
jgi:TonB dependent receptor/Carboxypeptidase regulatory-like domain